MIRKILETAGFVRRDESGGVTVEFVLMIPLLLWGMMATMAFFDAFRTKYSAQKATTTIADMVSRETTTLSGDYVDGLQTVFQTLTYQNANPGLRLTVVKYDEADDAIELVWSEVRGDSPQAWTDGNLDDIAARMPIMEDGDRFIVVETFSDYFYRFQPMLSRVLEDFEVETYATISPRFAPTICYQAVDGDPVLC